MKPDPWELYHLSSQLGLANGGTGRREIRGWEEGEAKGFAPDNGPGSSSRSFQCSSPWATAPVVDGLSF